MSNSKIEVSEPLIEFLTRKKKCNLSIKNKKTGNAMCFSILNNKGVHYVSVRRGPKEGVQNIYLGLFKKEGDNLVYENKTPSLLNTMEEKTFKHILDHHKVIESLDGIEFWRKFKKWQL